MRNLDRKRIAVIFLILCTGVCFCITSCQAGEKYFSGGPELFVSLDSTNELVPGTTMDLPLVLENKGTVTMEFYNFYTIQPDYIPTTALFTTVELVPGDAPVKVKTNPQAVGEVSAGAVVPADFTVEIPADAKAGNYMMEAIITYQFVPTVEQESTGTIEYYFKDAKDLLPVPVTIRPMVVLSVENVSSQDLHAGGEGYVDVAIKNTGGDTGNETSIYLTPLEGSPVVPYSYGIYVGFLPPGGTAQPRFKVAISEQADPKQSYPLSLYAVYRDLEGNTVQSAPVSTGVTFGEKVQLERISPPSVTHPGETGIVSATYRNSGNTPIYNAQARISVIDPFSSDDATAYLGDLLPGQSATAQFSVKTNNGATVKAYSVNSEIQYTNAANTAFVSDNIPVVIDVQSGSGTWTIVGILFFIIILGGGYLWYTRKKSPDRK